MKTIKLCAHGTPGFSDGKPYAVRDPCKNPPVPGHILCENCRLATGGMPRRLIFLPAQ